MPYFELDLDELGQRIEGIVDRAVSSQDYQKLNQTIRQAMEKVVDVSEEAIRRVSESSATVELQKKKTQSIQRLYGKTGKKTFGGIMKTVFGCEFSFASLFMLIISLVMDTTVGGHLVATALSSLCLGGSVWLTASGINTLSRLKRFRTYKNLLGNQTHCSIERLARGAQKEESFVRRDLWKMIGKGYFLEGHLDKEEKTLITSNETFEYYEQSRLAYEERKLLQEAQNASGREPKIQDEKMPEIHARAEEFLAQLRVCNDRIPGEEISEKISHIELLVQKIFDWAKKHPEVVPALKKMMDYYLPMTIKLLNAYADMDAQPVQGQTILASKREIENTLDTLTLAYEKLLDSVFQNVALDVSSDISVLNTLLAQEGLKEDELTKMQNKNREITPS